jgi:hypothetical protein
MNMVIYYFNMINMIVIIIFFNVIVMSTTTPAKFEIKIQLLYGEIKKTNCIRG